MSYSYVDRLRRIADKHHWPMEIHSRGYDATLVDVQPLIDGVAPIYRWPGGDGVAGQGDIERPASEFYRLRAILKKDPRALDDQCDLFRRQPADWYKELALAAMKAISEKLGPEQFTHCRRDTEGWAAHHVTKAVYEEQDVFDPYTDREFTKAAAALLPWYVARYTEEGETT